MLKFIRKNQYGLMLVVAIVVIIAFAWLYSRQDYGDPLLARRVQHLWKGVPTG